MNRFLIVVFLILAWSGSLRPPVQQVRIDAPKAGEALQGQVLIDGNTDLEGFQSFEVSFAYQQDVTNTWFPIATGKDTISSGTIATWDTTTITDGTYRVRVMVFLNDGRAVQTVVSGLRVRNYTAIETATPAPEITPSSGGETPAAGDYIPADSTAEPEPANPAGINGTDLSGSLALGGLVALGMFVLLGLYLALRALLRRLG